MSLRRKAGLTLLIATLFGSQLVGAQELSFDLNGSPVQAISIPYDANQVLVIDLINANMLDFDYVTNLRVSGLAPQPRLPATFVGPPGLGGGSPKSLAQKVDSIGELRKFLAKIESTAEFQALSGDPAGVTALKDHLRWALLDDLTTIHEGILSWSASELAQLGNPKGTLADVRKARETWVTDYGKKKADVIQALKLLDFTLPNVARVGSGAAEVSFWNKYLDAQNLDWGRTQHQKALDSAKKQIEDELEGIGNEPNVVALTCADQMMSALDERRSLFGKEQLEAWHSKTQISLQPSCPDFADVVDQEYASQTEPWMTRIPQDKLTQALASTGMGGGLLIELEPIPQQLTLDWAQGKPKLTKTPDKQVKPDSSVAKHAAHRVYRVTFGNPPGVLSSFGPFLSGLGHVEFDRFKNPDYDASKPGSSEFVVGRSEDSAITYGIAAFWSAALRKQENWGVSWGIAYTPQNDIEQAISGLLGGYWRPYKSASALVHFGALVGREKELAATVSGKDPVPIGASETIPVTQKTVVTWFIGIGFGFFGNR